MPIRSITEDGDFVAGLRLHGTVIYIDTWSLTNKDLNDYPHIILTSPHQWNPSKVQFPCQSEPEIEEFESRAVNISMGGPFLGTALNTVNRTFNRSKYLTSKSSTFRS
mmetsp:Transcript_26056/g.39441  ORF Transcript_26056/g.39441 Transcript_26056/m.39441 type:complete len:108 (+) Transcript_26056:49-372(+)